MAKSKLTAADKAYLQHPDALLLAFTKDNPYRDLIYSENVCDYKGQNRKPLFDNLLGNNNIPMYLCDFDKNLKRWKVDSSCVNRTYDKNVRNNKNKDIPVCHFRRKVNNIIKFIQNTELNKKESCCYIKKFLRDIGVTIISGSCGQGILLVIFNNQKQNIEE